MAYRLVVDGTMFSRKAVINDNLLTATLNTSSINGYGNPASNLFSIGNYTKTVNIGSAQANTVINFNGANNMYGDLFVSGNATFNGAFNFNGTYIYPNTFDFKTTTQNVSLCQNQGAGTTINLGNPTIPTLNTNIYGNRTQLGINNNNMIEVITPTNSACLDFHSSNTTFNDYDGRIICDGGNSTTTGQGSMRIISNSLTLPNTIKSTSLGSALSLFSTQSTGGNITIGSTSANTTLQGASILLSNNISSTNTTGLVNLFTTQGSGGDIIVGSSSVNVSVRGSSLSIPNNISSSNTTGLVSLFTNQGSGGDIIIGSSSVNVSVRGSSLSIPNNISSSNTTSAINLFTNQGTGGNITIGSSNINTNINGINMTIPNQLSAINTIQNVSLFTDSSGVNLLYGAPRKTNHILRGTNTQICYNTSSTTGVSPYLEMFATGDWAGIDFHSSDVTEADYDSRIICYTPTTPGTSGTSNMAIMAKNIGIGTTTPSGPLHIYEATGTTPTASLGTLILEHGNSGGQSSITFKSKVNVNSDYGYITYKDNVSGNTTDESSRLIIGVQNDLGDASNPATLNDAITLQPTGGNVGIGTVYPKYTLDVSGTVNADKFVLNNSMWYSNVVSGTMSSTGNNSGTIPGTYKCNYTLTVPYKSIVKITWTMSQYSPAGTVARSQIVMNGITCETKLYYNSTVHMYMPLSVNFFTLNSGPYTLTLNWSQTTDSNDFAYITAEGYYTQ